MQLALLALYSSVGPPKKCERVAQFGHVAKWRQLLRAFSSAHVPKSQENAIDDTLRFLARSSAHV